MPDHLEQLQEIFTTALECSSAEEQVAYLAKVCGDHPELQKEVESLLSAHKVADGYLQPILPQFRDTNLFPEAMETTEEFETIETIDKIGRYKNREPIGEGGFGLVYAAEQTAPVRRKVALKVIKLGMDTKEVLGRFEAEKQALAMLDHAHIAKVFDAGTMDTGRPYFVMELIRGMSIAPVRRANPQPTPGPWVGVSPAEPRRKRPTRRPTGRLQNPVQSGICFNI